MGGASSTRAGTIAIVASAVLDAEVAVLILAITAGID